MWADNVRYYFYSVELGRQIVPEPKNYKDGNGAKYTRDSKSKGILKKSSNTLDFTGAGYDYLLKMNALYGVRPDVRVDRWFKDPTRIDQRWTYIGSYGIDLNTLKFNHDLKTVKVSYRDGGLADKLETRLNEIYDLIEETSVTGEDIGPMPTVKCSLPGKAIFLESKLDIENGTEVVSTLSGGDRDGVRAVPFQVFTNPDGTQFNNDRDNVYSVTSPPLGYNDGDFAGGSEGGVTYFNSERDRNLTLKGRIHFDLDSAKYHTGYLELGIIKYDGGINLDFKEFIVLQTINTNGTVQGIDYTVAIEDFEILAGESFTFAWHHNTDDGIGVFYREGNTMSIIDEQPAPPSETRTMTFYQVFDRLMARAFGEHGLVKSSLLETGEFSETLKTNGLFVRQFPDVMNEGTEEERRIQFKTSLKKQLDSADCIHPIAYWTAKVGDKEVLRIEKLSYTQQGFVGVHYAEKDANGRYKYIPMQKVEREVMGGNYYSSATIGSTKTGDNYEDFFGLTSFCGNATYNFINDSTGVSYNKTMEDRTGDLDIEILRRKSYELFPDQDTAMDDDILFIDAKLVSEGLYTPRTWQDDFDEAPKNVYSPDTAFNFRYSPANLLLNHSYVLNAGLRHYPYETAKWASSNCNSSLVTKLIGKLTLEEGKPIPHSRFGKAKVNPMMIEAEMPVPLEVEEQLNGFQEDGTPNWFGRIAILAGQDIEYARLIDLDTNKQGKHQLIEAI